MTSTISLVASGIGVALLPITAAHSANGRHRDGDKSAISQPADITLAEPMAGREFTGYYGAKMIGSRVQAIALTVSCPKNGDLPKSPLSPIGSLMLSVATISI